MAVHPREPYVGLKKAVSWVQGELIAPGVHSGLQVWPAIEVGGQAVIHETLKHLLAWLIAVTLWLADSVQA